MYEAQAVRQEHSDMPTKSARIEYDNTKWLRSFERLSPAAADILDHCRLERHCLRAWFIRQIYAPSHLYFTNKPVTVEDMRPASAPCKGLANQVGYIHHAIRIVPALRPGKPPNRAELSSALQSANLLPQLVAEPVYPQRADLNFARQRSAK